LSNEEYTPVKGLSELWKVLPSPKHSLGFAPLLKPLPPPAPPPKPEIKPDLPEEIEEEEEEEEEHQEGESFFAPSKPKVRTLVTKKVKEETPIEQKDVPIERNEIPKKPQSEEMRFIELKTAIHKLPTSISEANVRAATLPTQQIVLKKQNLPASIRALMSRPSPRRREEGIPSAMSPSFVQISENPPVDREEMSYNVTDEAEDVFGPQLPNNPGAYEDSYLPPNMPNEFQIAMARDKPDFIDVRAEDATNLSMSQFIQSKQMVPPTSGYADSSREQRRRGQLTFLSGLAQQKEAEIDFRRYEGRKSKSQTMAKYGW